MPACPRRACSAASTPCASRPSRPPFEQARPDAVVNCVGIIKQLKEASDPVLTITLNSLLPHRLAALCAEHGARLVHMSTDCVFSGRKGAAYTEDDLPDPEDLYGRSKLLGEVDRPGCLTIRTSIFGRDFLKQDALLEWFLSNRGGRVRGYRNAVYSGFPTQVLARIIGDLLADQPALDGLVQIASAPITKYALLVHAQGRHGARHRDRAVRRPALRPQPQRGALRGGDRLPDPLLGRDGGRAGRRPHAVRRVEAGPCTRLRASTY